ncbi:MAG: phospholipid carrier-dependent glycosyltransferase [Burkholderiaceae bacterium]|nr:phospholipid carrier-dependent glycosyltransferase [Burkholderiaceae bacterium]
MQAPISIPSILFGLVLACVTYFYGVDSRFAPKNGDEYPYTHIVRMTNAADAWLPLQSEMVGIKNTKPPLLFWQGMLSTNHGAGWSLFNLRWPSLVYTALTTLLIVLSAVAISKNLSAGVLAGVIWLAFFNTYRYGRPYLAEPPEIFWLSLPFFLLLIVGKRLIESKLIFPLITGSAFGFALLYKSVAYIVPACLVLTLWYWQWRDRRVMECIQRDLFKVISIGLIALGLFALWFVFDPDPMAIWNEFVIGENAGKFAARNTSYLKDFVWGGDSVGMLLVTGVANAGFLAFVVFNLFYLAIRDRKSMSTEEKLLWIWIAVFFIIFSLPSQRSGRYLLPIMPAIAILLAMHWQQLSRWTFWLGLVLQGIVLIALAWLSWNINLWSYPIWHWFLLISAIAIVLIGLFQARFTKTATLLACFLTVLSLSSSIMPLDGAAGRFDAKTIAALQGKTVWFPCDFRAKDEEYRFLIPGANIKGYPASEAKNLTQLANQYSLFAVQAPVNTKFTPCPDCEVIGERLEMRARHSSDEIKAMLLGQVSDNLFVKEYIVFAPFNIGKDAAPEKDACR